MIDPNGSQTAFSGPSYKRSRNTETNGQTSFEGRLKVAPLTEIPKDNSLSQKEKPEFITTKGVFNDGSFSANYIDFNTTKFVLAIIGACEDWIENFSSDTHVVFVVRIKRAVEEYKCYLFLGNQHRILIGLVSLIFKNDYWKGITINQLVILVQELKRFKHGRVASEDLEIFSKQLFRNGIGVYEQEDL